MEIWQVKQDINTLRKQLEDMIDRDCDISHEQIRMSEELDKLIVEYAYMERSVQYNH